MRRDVKNINVFENTLATIVNQMDQTNKCFTTMKAEVEGWDPVKLGLVSPHHPLVIHYWSFKGDIFIVVRFDNCYVVFHFLMFVFFF